jgi:hypothetical protein
MKSKKQSFNPEVLIGTWESVNLNPTVLIYRNGNSYLLSIIYINETSKQASPSTCEIQRDRGGYYFSYSGKRVAVDYDARLDILILSSLGDYLRN